MPGFLGLILHVVSNIVNSLRQRLRQISRVEWLTILAIAAAVCLWSCQAYDQITAGLAVHDAAAAFAEVLRDTEGECRNRNKFLKVAMLPATPNRACTYLVLSGGQEIKRGELPSGVAAVGEANFDPQGVPLTASTFSFRKGSASARAVVDIRGTVFIP